MASPVIGANSFLMAVKYHCVQLGLFRSNSFDAYSCSSTNFYYINKMKFIICSTLLAPPSANINNTDSYVGSSTALKTASKCSDQFLTCPIISSYTTVTLLAIYCDYYYNAFDIKLV